MKAARRTKALALREIVQLAADAARARPLSEAAAKRSREIAGLWMELDARRSIAGDQFPSASAQLRTDEKGRVHEGAFP